MNMIEFDKRMSHLLQVEHYDTMNFAVETNIETLFKAMGYLNGNLHHWQSKEVAYKVGMDMAELNYRFVRESKKVEMMNKPLSFSSARALSEASITKEYMQARQEYIEQLGGFEEAKNACYYINARVKEIQQIISHLKKEYEMNKFIKSKDQ